MNRHEFVMNYASMEVYFCSRLSLCGEIALVHRVTAREFLQKQAFRNSVTKNMVIQWSPKGSPFTLICID